MKRTMINILKCLMVLPCLVLLSGCPTGSSNDRVVYALLPLSGPVGEVGQVIRKTMEMYKNSHPDMQFRIEFVDSESSPEKASRSLSQKLLSSGGERPIVITALSSISNMAIPLVDSMDGFVFALCTAQVTLKGNERNYLRFCIGPRDIIDPLSSYAQKYNSISVFYSNDDYGNSYLARLKSNLLGTKVSLKSTIPFSLTDQNARVNVQKALNLKPDAIVMLGMPTTAYVSHIRELKSQGFSGQIIGDNSFVNPNVYQKLGSDAEGVLSICTSADFSNPTTNEAKEFRTDCEKEGVIVYYVSSTTYDVLALLDSVFKNGKRPGQDLFKELKSFDGATGRVLFEDKGETFFECSFATVKGQKVVQVGEK